MIDPPRTKAEAEQKRYGQWAGSPGGRAYNAQCCAYEVPEKTGGWTYRQCSRLPGHGPEKLYCAQHAKSFRTKST